jgi:integrase
MNNTVTALRFFFRVTLDRPEMGRHLTLVRHPRKLPSVLNEEEVLRLLEHASGVKYRAALGVAYGAGLRVSEVANLKVSGIDSKRMLIRVEEGKGEKDRNAMLSPRLLELLRDWWWVGYDGGCTSRYPSRGDGWRRSFGVSLRTTPCRPTSRHSAPSATISGAFGCARCGAAVRRTSSHASG